MSFELTGVPAVIAIVLGLAVGIIELIAWIKLFVKAGQPGWAVIVPIYNVIVMCKIAGKPGWWILLLLIPVVNLVISIIVMVNMVKNFGKPGGHFFLLLFFGAIYIPYLAFSKNVTYQAVPQAA